MDTNRTTKGFVLFLLLSVLPIAISNSQTENKSKIVYVGDNGKLVYEPVSEKGDIIIDFSNVGYMGGGVPLPDVPVKVTLKPNENIQDDALRIQEAIDQISKMEPDNNGFRGSVLLKKGKYYANSTLRIHTSGVVLRGEGNSEEGTIIYDNVKIKNNFIEIIGTGSISEILDTRSEIVDDYVPVGTRIIHVSNPSLYKIGDRICVDRPGTPEWLHELGTDNIPKDFPQVRNWTPREYNLYWERKIVSINGNEITLDAPIVDALNKKLSTSFIYKYTFDGRVSQSAIENLRLESYFNPEIKHDVTLEQIRDGLNGIVLQKDYPQTYADEEHGWIAILINKAENCWVKNVTSKYFGYSCVLIDKEAKNNTVQDCEFLEPVSVIEGGRRYSFCINGQLNLMQRCFSNNGRHDFVLHNKTNGPNVFFDCEGEQSWSMTEGHHRWGNGCLWDNVIVYGPWAWMQAVNRSSSGTGHGWAAANMVYWNCDAKFFFIQKPPTAQNFAIGRKKVKPYVFFKSFEYDFNETLQWIEFHAKKKFPYSEGDTSIGDGYFEFTGSLVSPNSLYLAQLKDRLGIEAVKNILTEKQIKEYLNE